MYQAYLDFLARRRGLEFVKSAALPVSEHTMVGRLYVSKSGWGLVQVPNGFVRAIFDTLDETGLELPSNSDGSLNAHISVFTGDEVAKIGADKISERGLPFHYNLGPLKNVEPRGQSQFSRVWFVTVTSPELKELRRSYGLTPLPYGDHEFHITVAYRRRNVLRENELSKAAGFDYHSLFQELCDVYQL